MQKARLSLVCAILLAALLQSCATAPQQQLSPQLQAAHDFIRSYRSSDQVALQGLLSDDFATFINEQCQSGLQSCLMQAHMLPDPKQMTHIAAPQLAQDDAAGTQVFARYVTDDPATGPELLCLPLALQQSNARWRVAGIGAAEPCATGRVSSRQTNLLQSTATAQADIRERERQESQQHATQQAIAAAATATQQAIPTPTPERFLTARQAFQATHMRQLAHDWAADAVLVQVALEPKGYTFYENMVAWDGTSRVWVFTFASPSSQKMRNFFTQDGVLMEADQQSASDYKKAFAGQGQPFDIPLESLLDSDQAVTIALENGLNKDSYGGVMMQLTITPEDKLLAAAPAQWRIGKYFMGLQGIILNSADGMILSNSSGPTGSPGRLPTAIAPADGTGTAPATPERQRTATPAFAEATATVTLTAPGPLTPGAALASMSAEPGRDAKGNVVSYGPENVIDGQAETAWRVAGDGSNNAIYLFFKRPVRIHELHIIPGYAKIDPTDGTNRFTQNRRVKKIRISFFNGISQEAALADSPTEQTIALTQPVLSDHIQITILASTQHGGRDFTAISELSAVGQECPAGACGADAESIREISRDLHDPRGMFTIEKIQEGRYARLSIHPYTTDMDTAIALAKRENGTWSVLTIGTTITPGDLVDLGLPPDLLD